MMTLPRISRWFGITVALVAVLAAVGCSDQGQLFEKTIPAPTLQDNLLGDPAEQPIAVYLPPSYASTSDRYPVVYLLPGFTAGVDAFLDGRFQGFELLPSMDRLVENGNVREMIVVVANGRNLVGGSGYVNSPVTGNWEDFVVKNVVRYVDRHYKTIPYTESRGIAGESLGGFGALNIAMRHPDVFGAVYAMSPALIDPDGLRHIGVFDDPDAIKDLLREQRELGAMKREDAHAAFASLVEKIFTSGDADEFKRLVTYAYGTAFSPDPEANAPYIHYPYTDAGDSISLDAAVWRDWENGVGGIDAKVETYKENFLKLGAITLEYGTREEFSWIPAGCAYYSQRLAAAGIAHELVTFDGGHSDRLGERIEEHMLPFFSRVLSFE